MTFAMLSTNKSTWTPRPGDSVMAGNIVKLSASTSILEQTQGFHLLARSMRSKHGDAGDEGGEAAKA